MIREFSSLLLENKYKLLIEEELNNFNKNRDLKMEWANINKIVKKESRWERD